MLTRNGKKAARQRQRRQAAKYNHKSISITYYGCAASTLNCFGSNPPFEPRPHFQPIWSQIWRWGCKNDDEDIHLRPNLRNSDYDGDRDQKPRRDDHWCTFVAPRYHRLCSDYHCPYPLHPLTIFLRKHSTQSTHIFRRDSIAVSLFVDILVELPYQTA